MLKLNNVDFIFREYTSENNKDEIAKIPQISLLEEIIEKERNGNIMANDNGDVIYIFDDKKKDISTFKKYNLVGATANIKVCLSFEYPPCASIIVLPTPSKEVRKSLTKSSLFLGTTI